MLQLAIGRLRRTIWSMKGSYSYRRTTIMLWACLALLGGIGAARVLPPVSGVALVACIALCALTFRKRRLLALLSAVALGFSVGLWRGSAAFARLKQYDDFKGQSVTVLVTAETDSSYDQKSQMSFEGSDVEVIEPTQTHLIGKITAGGYGERMIYRGDRVEVTGKFYMTRGSKVASISFAELQTVKRSTNPINTFQRKFFTGMLNALPEPQASFAVGLLVGSKSGLDKATADTLAAIGLTHIVAVSGYNLTIIIRAMRRLLGKFSKYQMMLASLLLIAGFLAVTGLGASIVRASIVSVLSLLGWYYGRTVRPLLLIALTAAMTALWNPLYVWSDIGWYLSFLAFFGVMVLGPLLHARLARGREPKLIAGVVLETLAAEIMTLPFILYIFGETSAIALLANVLVVPLLPLGMLLSFAAGLAGMLVPSLAGWVAWPAKALLTYLLDVAGLLVRVPHMHVNQSLPLAQLLILYAAALVIMRAIWKKTAKARIITEVDT